MEREVKNYWYGLIICLLWFGIIKFYRFDEYKYDYKITDVVLSENPEFKVERYSKTKKHWFELNFVGYPSKYKINAVEYEFLKTKEFKSNIKKGDSVKIVEYDQRIFSIIKNNVDYLNYEKAENYKKDGEYSMTIIMSTLLLLCLLPILVNREIDLSYEIKKVKFKYDYVFTVFFVIVLIYFYKNTK